jgi:uncharacterized RDD family membrane protein YckC
MNESLNWPAPDPIHLNIQYANYWIRVVAWFSDVVNVVLIFLTPMLLLLFLLPTETFEDQDFVNRSQVIWQIASILLLAYWHGRRGGSPLRLRTGAVIVDHESLAVVGIPRALLRSASALIIPLLFFPFGFGAILLAYLVNYLWPLWDKRNQTLHDKIAKTIVIMK